MHLQYSSDAHSIRVRISDSTIAYNRHIGTAQLHTVTYCDPCRGWRKLQELQTQRGAETRVVDLSLGCSKSFPTPQLLTLAAIEP